MNDITRKIIHDGSENQRAKRNLYSIMIGTFLLLMGMMCIFIKANSVEYIDASGILYENFFLIPIAFLFLLSGFLVILVASIRYFRK